MGSLERVEGAPTLGPGWGGQQLHAPEKGYKGHYTSTVCSSGQVSVGALIGCGHMVLAAGSSVSSAVQAL